ncbi:MAG: hypothetical protein ACHQCH_06590 [Solirubrobacterales bacterium]
MIRRKRPAAIALTLLLVGVRLVLLISGHGGSVFHPSPYPSCGTAAFEPPESQQGLCTVYEGSGIRVKNIVDRNSTLHMPEFDARVLTWTSARTRVSNWRNEPKRFPEGHGALVSLEVEISNPGSQPLLYGPLIARSPVPSYRPHPPAELALPIPAGPGQDFSAAALFNARGAPGPSLFGQPPIPPHAGITGWISVVVAPYAASLVGMRRSALELSPVDGNPNYVGIIRLWKNAAPEVAPSRGV